jgi:hypothetical protein
MKKQSGTSSPANEAPTRATERLERVLSSGEVQPEKLVISERPGKA